MTKRLHKMTPTHAHALAGRVVSILRRGGLTERPVLTEIHQIVERRASDPRWVKAFLLQVVDGLTKREEPLNYYRDHVRRDIRDQATPGFDYSGLLAEVMEDTGAYDVRHGEEIRSLTRVPDVTPDPSLGETFRFAAYESEDTSPDVVHDEHFSIAPFEPAPEVERWTLPVLSEEEVE